MRASGEFLVMPNVNSSGAGTRVREAPVECHVIRHFGLVIVFARAGFRSLRATCVHKDTLEVTVAAGKVARAPQSC